MLTLVGAVVPLCWTTYGVQGWRRTSQTVPATDCTFTIVDTMKMQEWAVWVSVYTQDLWESFTEEKGESELSIVYIIYTPMYWSAVARKCGLIHTVYLVSASSLIPNPLFLLKGVVWEQGCFAVGVGTIAFCQNATHLVTHTFTCTYGMEIWEGQL